MQELENESVHLMVTSPPYFNAPFDYEGLYDTYDHYLGVPAHFISLTYYIQCDCEARYE